MGKEKSDERRRPVEAYLNEGFLNSAGARALRILSEYLEPQGRFERYQVDDTIVFMGSARIVSREQAQRELKAAERGDGDLERARLRLDLSQYFEILTLLQTRKIRKHLPVVLFGTRYRTQVIDLHALIRHGMIQPRDVALFHQADSVDDAFQFITQRLTQHAIEERGAIL